ncbi:MAG: hypothetical protein IJ793_02690 [Opitutales bacterium]|nr:hypothetical protein [Opitutales bacterium]
MRHGTERNLVPNRKSGGFTIIGMMLSLTVTAIVGSALLAFFNRFRVCNGESEVKDQARRVAEGLTNYKNYYGIWPYFGDANGEPKKGKYGAVDYVFPVDNWIEVTRYAHELPAVLSGENRYGCNPLKKRFGEFSENEKKGEEIHRFWIYLRSKRSESTEEFNRPYRLWGQVVVKVVGKNEYNNDITQEIPNVPVDEIWGDEVLFYIPKKDEKLHWQPMAQGREGWEDGGRKRRSQNTEQQDCFLGVNETRGDDDGGGDGGKQTGRGQQCS